MIAAHRGTSGLRLVAVVAILLASATCTAVLVGGAADARADTHPPNVVVVLTDDQRADDLEVMSRVRRRLAQRGTAFDRFYTTFPLCCPSRATLLTGQYAHNHGVLSNNAATGGGMANFDDSGTVALALQQAGFRTGFVGKYLNGYQSISARNPRAIPQGWSRWFGATVPGKMFNWTLNENGRQKRYRGERNYQTDVLARKANRFIRTSARQQRPFFLTVATLAPHRENKRARGGQWPNPRPAPRHRGRMRNVGLPRTEAFNEADVSDKPPYVRSQRRLTRVQRKNLRQLHRSRRRSLLAVDELVGGIVQTLRDSRQLARTYVIFTSDNGYLLGEHRLIGKSELYEESARVPLVIRGPGMPAGATRSQTTGNVDLVPTILDATGVDPLREPDGRSLLPLAADPQQGSDRHLLLHRGLGGLSRRSVGVRGPRHAYFEHGIEGGRTYELYDMAADPLQLENLVDPGSGALRDPDPQLEVELTVLRSRLAQLRDCRGTSGPSSCG